MAKRGSNSLKAMEIYAGLYYPISNKVCDKMLHSSWRCQHYTQHFKFQTEKEYSPCLNFIPALKTSTAASPLMNITVPFSST